MLRLTFQSISPKFQQELVYKLVPTGTGHLEFPVQEIFFFMLLNRYPKLQIDASNNIDTVFF